MALLSDNDVFGSPSGGLLSDDDVFGAQPKKQNKGIAGDIATGLKRGVEQIPGMVTGLADIAAAPVSAVTGINRPFSRGADYLGEKTGFQPGKWSDQAAQEYSPEMQRSLQNVQKADGFVDTLGAIAQNPRAAVNLVAESLPSTLAGGILARGAMGAVAGAEKLAAMKAAGDTAGLMKAGAIAGGIGEGAVTAGQQMAQTDYGADPLRAAGAATAAGIGTGIIGGVSGRVANKLGLADIEGSIASGTLGAGKKAGVGAYAGRIAGGAAQEGLIEELPQSAQEQIWQNVANSKPWDEGVGSAAAQGLVAGMAMGAGVNAMPGSKYVESKRQPTEDKPEIAGLLPAPSYYTGTPGDRIISADTERQAAIDAADANAAAVYAAREAFEKQLRQSVNIVNEPAPLQQRIDELLNVDQGRMTKAERSAYEKELAAAFSEPIGVRHDANQNEVPFTIGEYLDAQSAAEDAVRSRPLKQNAVEQSGARLQQVADEETSGYVAPEIPVVGTLSAVANMAIKSGAHAQNQMQQAMQAALAKQGKPEKANGPIAAATDAQVATQAPQANDAQAAPAGQFDVSQRTDGQLAYLSQNGKPGWKESAIAEMQRRGNQAGNALNATNSASTVALNEQQASPVEQQQAPVAQRPNALRESAERRKGNAARDDLVGAIMRVTGGRGIAANMAQTVVGDKANNATKVRGLFTNVGIADLDDTATLLRDEEGYDVRDGNHLAELIRSQADGNPVYSTARIEREAAAEAEKRHRDEIRSKAKKFGIKTVARPFGEIEKEVLRRIDERHTDAVNKLDARARSRFDAMLRHAVEVADFDEVDAIITDAQNRFIGREFFTQATRQLRGYIDDLTRERQAQEQSNAIEETQGTSEEPDWLRSGTENPGGRSDPAGAPESARRQAGQQEAGLTLEGQTNEQAAEQFAQQQAGDSAEITKEQADRERDAVPFAMQQQSQPKPQGVQTGLFTADGRPSVASKHEQAQGDLVGASKKELDSISASIEEKRGQLVAIEDKIVGAAGLASGFIEDALRSRKVSAELKGRRQEIRAELADLRKQYASLNNQNNAQLEQEQANTSADSGNYPEQFKAGELARKRGEARALPLSLAIAKGASREMQDAWFAGFDKGTTKKSTADQEPVKNETPSAAAGSAEAEVKNQEPIKKQDQATDSAPQQKADAAPEAKPTPAVDAEKQAESKSPAAIGDFGEKIGGAKKDLWTGYKEKLTGAEALDIKAEPLSKSWPVPDYESLIESGVDSFVVAFVRAARDSIPRKPTATWKLKSWAGGVEFLRDTSKKLIDGELSATQAKELLQKAGDVSRGMRDIAGRIELYQLVGHRQSLDGFSLSHHFYTLYKGKENVSLWAVEKEAKATAFSNWPAEFATGATKQEALDKFKALYDKTDFNQSKSNEVTFDLYSQGGKFYVGKKMGRNITQLAGPFDTIKETRAYRDDHHDELVSRLEKAKEIPKLRRDRNEPRVGEDMRDGQDVTPEMFAESFGFKGVEFGNWVEQKRRQKDLNESFDALMDMAAILNIPPKALSLNGQLGLAFGARGTGGIDPAAAHYERSFVAINLTKKEGAGSLGHEWFHALDNYFSRLRGKGLDMMTEALDVSLAGRGSDFVANTAVRKEMILAFGRVVNSIKMTAIRERSAKLDNKRSKAYWTTTPEMSARAFESYLISKLHDQNASNDYLANIVDPKTWEAAESLGFELDDSYPYPTAGEMPLIREAFDKFFQTVETKQTDKGIALHEESAVYTVNEPDGISGDLFQGTENALPASTRKDSLRPKPVADSNGAGARPVLAIREAPDSEGVYYVQSQLVTVGERNLPVDRINSPEDAARAFASLSRFAVEHLDGLVTDKDGKPLAIIGGFKGAPTQAQAYPSTLMMELSRIDGAANLWLSHNHPSGVATLSRADENLSSVFGRMLEGSSVTYRGLSAMARKGNVVQWSDTDYNNGEVTFGEPAPHAVPIVERELIENSPGSTVSSPAEAKRLVAEIAKEKPGIVFVTAQNQIASFVPFDPEEMGRLRAGDRLMRLFRAAARSGGAGAFVAMPDGKVNAAQFANLKGALEQIDVRALDGIEYQSDGSVAAKSLAEKGFDASAGAAFGNVAGAGNITTADKSIYGMAAEGKSAAEILKFIASASRNPMNRQLAKLLLKTGIAPSITVGDGKGWKMNAGEGHKYAAAYNPKTDTVALFRPASAERHVLHELIHAATLRALGKKSLASAQMKALFAHVQKNGRSAGLFYDAKTGAGIYGMANVDEFVAEVFSNPKFQQMLKQVSAPQRNDKPSSAWDWFVRVVRGILGVPQGQENALSRAIELGVGVMREDMKIRRSEAGVQFSEIAGDEIEKALGRTIQEKARNWMKARLQGKSFQNDATGWDISVGRKGIGKVMMHAAKDVHSRSVVAIPDLIKNAVLVASEANRNTKERDDVPMVHHFYAPLRVGGSEYVARLVVKETRSGQRFYDFDTSDEIGPAVLGETHTLSQTRGAAPSARLDVSMAELLSYVKAEHGGTDPKFIRYATGPKQTDSAAFRKWFGDSKVVDASGNPLVVYHGTGRDFDEFLLNKAGSNSDTGMWGTGFYFSTSPKEASRYARGETPNVIPVYLSLINPIEITNAKELPSIPGPETIEEMMVAAKTYSDTLRAKLIAKGHDGLIWTRADGSKEIVAFYPNQIKSAIGNNGDFDGTNPDIRYNVADEGWSVSEPSKMDDLIYAMQDKQIDLKRVVQSIMRTGKRVKDEVNAYLQEELFHGRAAKGVKDFLDFELRPLLKQMQETKVDMGDFEEYLWNRHAEERNKQIAKINPDMPDGGSGIETAKARAYLAGLSAEQRKTFEALAAKVETMNRESQRVLVESGLEKQSTIDAWNGAYQHYVPLQREDVDSGHVGTGKGFSVRGSSSKRAMGSGKKVVDIIANLTMQRERNIVRAEKNRVSNALLGLAVQNPNPDFWKVDQAPKERVVQEKAIYTVLDSDGNKIEEFTRMDDAERLANKTPGASIDQTWGDRVTERVTPGFTSRDNVLLTRINGEDHYVIFNERDERAMRMATAMKSLDMDNLGRVLSVVGKATRYLASINTQYNPIFGVINLVRDTQGALINLSSTPLAGEQKRVLGYTKDALVGIYKDIRAHRSGAKPSSNWAALFEEFQKEGGQTGYRDQYANAEARAESIKSELEQFKDGKAKQLARGLFGWLSDYNETMENAVRLAAYKAAKEKGMSNQQAASLAKNITVNFNRKGQMATQVGALYAFYNASVQGSARIAETLFEQNGGDIKNVRLSKKGKQILAGGIMLGAMQALLLAAAGFDDDEPPEFIRERNLILPIGGGKYLTLAMPLGLHVIPGIGRIATEFVLSGGKDPLKRIAAFGSMFADAFNPVGSAGWSLQTITPSVVDPFAALAENKDFTGKEIYREDFNKLNPTPGHARAKDVATFYSRWISEAMNFMTGGTEFKPGLISWSPDSIDYLVSQAGGGVMREANKVLQTTGAAYSGEDLPLYKIPLVGRFVGDTAGQSGQSAKFYDAIKQINMHEAQYKGLIKDGRSAEAREYLAENPAVKLIMAGNHAELAVRKLRTMKRDLVENEADPAKVRAIDDRITATMRAFNERAQQVI